MIVCRQWCFKSGVAAFFRLRAEPGTNLCFFVSPRLRGRHLEVICLMKALAELAEQARGMLWGGAALCGCLEIRETLSAACFICQGSILSCSQAGKKGRVLACLAWCGGLWMVGSSALLTGSPIHLGPNSSPVLSLSRWKGGCLIILRVRVQVSKPRGLREAHLHGQSMPSPPLILRFVVLFFFSFGLVPTQALGQLEHIGSADSCPASIS